MASKRKKPILCMDTYNYLARDDKGFHWSRAYSWYADQLVEQRMKSNIWLTGLENVGCMLEVFNARDLVSWCSKIFELGTRTIRLGGISGTPIMLTHHVFNKIINFPEGGKDLGLS